MIHINLLPVRVSKKKAAGKQQLILFAVIVVVGYGANFAWASARSSELAAVERKVKATRDEIAQLDRIIGEVKNIKEQQAALREKLDTLARLKTNRVGPVKMLDALASVTPRRLWLTKLEEKSGVVTFAGAAATIEDVSEFMTALKASPQFSTVELTKTVAVSGTAQKRPDHVEFTLSAAVGYGQPAAQAGPAGTAGPAGPAAPAGRGR